ETDGAFDISTGALTKAWGFFRRQGRVPGEAERAEARSHSGMQHILLDDEKRTISFRRAGLELNLGSIGKGYALDRVVELLRGERGVQSALVHGGRSSVLALGDEPGRRGGGWGVGIADPRQPDRRLAVIRLRNRALGTSAATYQHLEHEG